MKTMSLRKFCRTIFCALFLLLGLTTLHLPWTAAKAQTATTGDRPTVAEPMVSLDPAFFVRGYGGKCLDFGPPPQVSGAPVFIYDCNGTAAQQVRVEEINSRHDIILRAGHKVISVKSELVIAPSEQSATQLVAQLETETPLELQDEKNRDTVFSLGQIFALDGDSIILASDRDHVVKVQDERGSNRTPLVLGRRELNDSEFWTFSATDGSDRKPSSGFVRVPQEKDFVSAVQLAAWGTVIEVGADISLKDHPALRIPAGVTIRGDRRGTHLGPELWAPNEHDQISQDPGMLQVFGNDVRITGLRMRGPSRSADGAKPIAVGVFAPDNFTHTIIDHNDMSDWTNAAIQVEGGNSILRCGSPNIHRQQNVRVARNFIHHNQNWTGGGYGVVTGGGGYPSIEGNTFLSNRHSIAGDGAALTGYKASFNLILSATPIYSDHGSQQEFDMHGTDPSSGHSHIGGVAGDYIEIAWNTFLARNRLNFYLRGTPCNRAEFHDNVSLGRRVDVIKNLGDRSGLLIPGSQQFEAPNPTSRLGVGDFDGDGVEDLFLATGAAWYYAPAGNAEWRLLNAQTEGISSLLYGDFDGDGRTDVFTQRGRDWLVSWGGASRWQKINESNSALSEFRIGDFVGDQRADVFYADGQGWWVSDGGVGPFTNTQHSSFRAADLGFGDFNSDGKTDVVGVVGGKWAVSLSATGSWAGFPLRAALTTTMAGLIVTDFNGNGRADIATRDGKISYDGSSDWTHLPARTAMFAAIGRFDANPGADILFFWTHDNYLGIQSSGVGAPKRHSRQDMR
jgi:hypothetical protein